MSEQSELGVISGLRGSSLTGRGRAGGSVSDPESDPEPMEDSAMRSGSAAHVSTTDCSTQRKIPGSEE